MPIFYITTYDCFFENVLFEINYFIILQWMSVIILLVIIKRVSCVYGNKLGLSFTLDARYAPDILTIRYALTEIITTQEAALFLYYTNWYR